MLTEPPSIYSYDVLHWANHWLDALAWDPVALFTLILSISTIALWWATRRLWQGAEMQARDLMRSADAAAASAKSSADAAQIAHATARPWVKFEISKAYLYFHSELPEEVGCQINFSAQNIGATPAIDVSIVYKPIPVGYGVDTDIYQEIESLMGQKGINPRVLFPMDEIVEGRSTNFPFPPQANEDFLGFKIVAAVTYRATLGGDRYWTPAVVGLQLENPPADRVHRFFRGMGDVPCLTMPLGDETPQPT